MEREFNFEVIGYYHEELELIHGELDFLDDLNHRILFLGRTVIKFRGQADQRLKTTATAVNGLAENDELFVNGTTDERLFLSKCLRSVEYAKDKCWDLYLAASHKLENLTSD